jgi:hypothetical protein
MRRIATLALASASLLAMTAGDAAAAGKNPPTSCGLGAVVSESNQYNGGIGKFLHEMGFSNVGHVLQGGHEATKEECNGNFDSSDV